MKKAGEGKTVFVGMSGGVDSSVAALLLVQEGYAVVGVFIKVWHPDFLPCDWETERLDAMRVAAHLGIPFLTCDAEEAYKNEVAEYFIREYREGRTPNPDVMCNTHVKFGAFYRFAKENGADYIATGHYARREEVGGEARLLRGIDPEKDQSYFLWNIEPDALEHTLFPVGLLLKSEVRTIAKNAELPTAEKDESQGICFLGHVDIKEFLSHYMELIPGDVLDEEGVVIGAHDGTSLYTIGQRHGLRIFPQHAHADPYFVVGKNFEKNTLTVSHKKPVMAEGVTELALAHARWKAGNTANEVTFQTRYRQRPVAGTVSEETKGGLIVRPAISAEMPAIGQSCVLYDADVVLGGGIIDSIKA